jgi:hypothetical protein
VKNTGHTTYVELSRPTHHAISVAGSVAYYRYSLDVLEPQIRQLCQFTTLWNSSLYHHVQKNYEAHPVNGVGVESLKNSPRSKVDEALPPFPHTP